MSNQVNSMNKGLTVKDLVTTGIFTALLFVFVSVLQRYWQGSQVNSEDVSGSHFSREKRSDLEQIR